MAKISNELKSTLVRLQHTLLLIVDDAKAAELTVIAQQSSDLYVQISRLLLRTAEIQPIVTEDMLGLLTDRVETVSNRVPALDRSIQEIKSDWGL